MRTADHIQTTNYCFFFFSVTLPKAQINNVLNFCSMKDSNKPNRSVDLRVTTPPEAPTALTERNIIRIYHIKADTRF